MQCIMHTLQKFGADKIKIYNYNSNIEKTCTGTTYAEYSDGNYYLSLFSYPEIGKEFINYTFGIGTGAQHYTNVATILYKDIVKSDGNTYDVKLDIEEIDKTGTNAQHLQIRAGQRNISSDNKWNVSTYTEGVSVEMRMVQIASDGTDLPMANMTDETCKLEVKVKYSIIDKNGNEKSISGLLGIEDLDLREGLFIDDFIANPETNIFTPVRCSDSLKYKTVNNGTYFYTDVSTDIRDNSCDEYLLITRKSNLNMVLTWDRFAAGKSLTFVNENQDIVKRYKKITTEVIGGTITPTIDEIENGENRTVEYAPNDSSKQYLKSVKVDGVEQDLETYANSYTFSNITEDHEIIVEYANKYKVVFDSKGGSPTPETQYVLPNETAIEPETNPTKNGYTFKGWVKTDV